MQIIPPSFELPESVLLKRSRVMIVEIKLDTDFIESDKRMNNILTIVIIIISRRIL